MKRHNLLVVLLLAGGLLGSICPGPQIGFGRPIALGQEDDKPLSKAEILSMLKQSELHRMTQGAILVEIHRRGINFPVDIKTIEEFRLAGAKLPLLEAIRQVAEESTRPKLERRDSDSGNPAQVRSNESDEDRSRISDEALAKLPLLEQARYHALDFARELPNFVVTQIVTRTAQFPRLKKWQFQDKLEIELTYRVDKGEEFKILGINGAPSTQSYEDLGGSTSSGEFGTVLAALFAPQTQTEFKEAKREKLRGRDAVVFDYNVKKENSNNRLEEKKTHQWVITAYSGSIWIDAETKRVLRIEASSDDIPAKFPISMAEHGVDYDWVTIAGERYLLPIHAEVLLGQANENIYTKNIIEFRNYHKFEGTIKVVPN